MSWVQIKVEVTSEVAEIVGDKLAEETSALSVTFMDAEDTPIFEPEPGEFRLWQDTVIVALYPEETDPNAIREYLQASNLLPENFLFTAESLQDKVWEREWMDAFHPMQFGEKLWICPSWCELPDKTGIHVMLDPGLAFGTGTHATTALCLEWLEKQDLSGKTLIDFGCGSGILAIAALKLGAKNVIGVDIDPQAIESSQINAERNGVANSLTLHLAADLPNDTAADIVIANILAGPLCDLSDQLLSLIPRGGQLAMSGILQTHASSVVDTYANKLAMETIEERDGWVRVAGTKR